MSDIFDKGGKKVDVSLYYSNNTKLVGSSLSYGVHIIDLECFKELVDMFRSSNHSKFIKLDDTENKDDVSVFGDILIM